MLLDEYNPWGTQDASRQAQDRLRKLKERWSGPAAIGIVLAVIALWLLTGVYTVNTGEIAVVRRFGTVVGLAEPGLHFRLPFPIQTHNVVNIESVRRAEVGFRSADAVGRNRAGRVSEEALMLTGDENIVELQMIVQYKVQDPAAFLFNVREPEATLHAAAEVAVRSIVGISPIDFAMSGEGREEQQMQVREYLQELLDLYGTGLRTTEVRFNVVDAPDQVRDAFHDVVRAYEERERKVNQALAYQADIVPRARGEAQQILRQAEAFREERVRRASGDAAHFSQMLTEYEQAPDVTRQRMYLEAIERVLPNAEKIILSGEADGVLPLLPLNQGGK